MSHNSFGDEARKELPKSVSQNSNIIYNDQFVKPKLYEEDMGNRSSTSNDHSDSVSTVSSGDENKTRGNWGNKLDFLLSCVGYAVGLGNIWRFPILCYRNGGATFLIPYLIFMILCGIPLFFLEVSYGQFASRSPTTFWKISPIFKGVGYGMVIISGVVCIYYNIIITWTLFYLFKSFMYPLPWTSCEGYNASCADESVSFGNFTADVFDVDGWNAKCAAKKLDDAMKAAVNSTNVSSNAAAAAAGMATKGSEMSPSNLFWNEYVLELSKGIEDIGIIRWQLLLCLFLAWALVFLCLCRGVKSSGKVVYVTATFPYIVLVIFLVRGVTLPGAWIGLRTYLVPDLEKLMTFEVWSQAASQIFYSVGAAWGALITMASYNRFNHNCLQDAIVVPLINCGTSIFAGFVVFSILGFMAHLTCQDNIEAVAEAGPGLIFVVYPSAISRLPISPLWAILFFLMIFTLGLDSQFGMFETLTSAFIDEFPLLRSRKLLFIAFLCVVECIIGISMVAQGGMYVLHLIDWYSSTFSLMVLSILECVVISWIYGIKRFSKDIELMLGRQPPKYFQVMWMVGTPLIVIVILGANIFGHQSVYYERASAGVKYIYPDWAVVIGWLLAFASLLPLLLCAVWAVHNAKGDTLLQRIKNAAKPTPQWGPALEQHRILWKETLPENLKDYYDTCIDDENENSDTATKKGKGGDSEFQYSSSGAGDQEVKLLKMQSTADQNVV